uniref:R13L1/DRL21-like LRR repeat region domain-containing protein n=1 Tax=Leersia perrieri TaxID=77586 RepID=A0A0D9VEH4_9ORYZ
METLKRKIDIGNLQTLMFFGEENRSRLEEFHVKKERIGFELSELRNLKELRGELKICNLEKVTTREEAEGAKLNWKRNLKTLMLVWGPVQRTIESDVPDGLEPPSNLKELVIKNHGGSIGPSWLCREICVNNLRSLHLEGVSWGTPTPFGQLMQLEELTLIKIASIHKFGLGFGGVTEKSFPHLKKVEFVDMPELLEWVRGVHCHLFSKVASIWCEKCPNLSMLLLQLPSSDCSAAPCAQDINTTWFPNLCDLYIAGCPKLSLPPMPHTSTLTSAKVFGQTGGMLFEKRGWMYMATAITIKDPPHVSLTDLQKMSSLTELVVKGCECMLFSEVEEGVIFRSVQKLSISDCRLTGNSLRKFLNRFPAITKFKILCCKNLVLPVEDGEGLQDLSSLQKLKI